MILAVLLACRAPEGARPLPAAPGDVAGPALGPLDPALRVTSIVASQPWHANELLLTVTTTAPAELAAVCTLDADPAERHLARATAPGLTRAIRVPGLLADSAYTCRVTPIRPRGAAAEVAVTTGPLPDDVPETEVLRWDDTNPDLYVLANWSDATDYSTGLLLVFDPQGRVRWWARTPDNVGPSVEFVYLGGDRFAWGGGWTPNAAGRPRLLDLYDGEIWDSGSAIPDVESSAFHHDGKRLWDGRWATLEAVQVLGEESSFGGFQVRILDPETNTVASTYDAQRAVDEGHLPSGSWDAWHANWVDTQPTPEGGQELLVGLRNLSSVISVDADTGDWRWRFGPGGDFVLQDASGAPLGDEGYPSWLHAPVWDGETLLVYDNGVSAAQTRVVAYTLDTQEQTATLDWSWTEDGWYEAYLGSVRWLPDGHVLVGSGHAEPYSTTPGGRTAIFEIDPERTEKLWQLTYTDVNAMAYRASWADGCDLFNNAAICATVADEIAALEAGISSE